jgi:protein transport protein SEC23
MDFQESEALDGLRFSWNVWPSSRIEATRMVVPFGAIVTPLHKLEGMPVLPYEPVTCKGCSSVLNPYCRVDFQVLSAPSLLFFLSLYSSLNTLRNAIHI